MALVYLLNLLDQYKKNFLCIFQHVVLPQFVRICNHFLHTMKLLFRLPEHDKKNSFPIVCVHTHTKKKNCDIGNSNLEFLLGTPSENSY